MFEQVQKSDMTVVCRRKTEDAKNEREKTYYATEEVREFHLKAVSLSRSCQLVVSREVMRRKEQNYGNCARKEICFS